ncbi:MAG: glycosyltransferase family 2 protein [Pyrobaculum sp.]
MINISFINVTIPPALNETLYILNKTREGPVTISNAPPIPQWIQDMFLLFYSVLLLLAILLMSHYIYYARHVEELVWDPPSNSSTPLSIIIPVKNENVEVIKNAVERLRGLVCENSEIVIVSDDPPEAFEKIKKALEGLPNVKILRRPSPSGYKGTALNWAVEYAGGDVLLFLDVDSIPPVDICQRARSVGEREILFMGWDGYTPIKTPVGLIQLFLYKYLLYYVAIIGRHNTKHPVFALGSGIAIRKKFLKELGGFCNCTADDYDISFKTYLHGGRVAYAPGPPVYVEVPAGYTAFKNQYARWTYNSAYLLALYFTKIWKLKMPLVYKLSIFLNIATHALMILTTLATMAVGVAMGYMGILLPPLYILLLQSILFAIALIHTYYVYKLARRDGYRFWSVAGLLAKSTALLITLSPYLSFYVLLGILRRRIRWLVTPKGVSALMGGAWGLYEISTVAVLGSLLAAAVYSGNYIFVTNTLFLLTVFLYTYLRVAIPSSQLGRG